MPDAVALAWAREHHVPNRRWLSGDHHGSGRVRHLAPVPVGSRLGGTVEPIALGDDLGGGQVEALVKEPHSAPTRITSTSRGGASLRPTPARSGSRSTIRRRRIAASTSSPAATSSGSRLSAISGQISGRYSPLTPEAARQPTPLPAARWGLLVPLRPHDPWRGREHDAGVTAARSPPRSCPPTSASTAVATSASSATSTSTLTDVYPRR